MEAVVSGCLLALSPSSRNWSGKSRLRSTPWALRRPDVRGEGFGGQSDVLGDVFS